MGTNDKPTTQIVEVVARDISDGYFTYTGIDVDGNEIQLRKKATRLYAFAFAYDSKVSSSSNGLAAHFLYGKKPNSHDGKPRGIYPITYET